MALAYPIERRYQITTADHGKFPTLGEASDRHVGAWRVQFSPDEGFVGSLQIVGRSSNKGAHDDAVGFGTVAYHRVQLGGVASDWNLVADVLAGDAIVLVPASGLSIAVAVTCTAGTATLYSQPLEGSAAP